MKTIPILVHIQHNIVIRPNDLKKTIESQSLSRIGSFPKDVFKKLKHYSQNIPIISESWINTCYEYTFNFSYKFFEVENPTGHLAFSEEHGIKRSKLYDALEEGINRIRS